MRTVELDPLGVEVTDLAVGELDPMTVDRLRDLLARHGVLVLPEQDVDDVAFSAFLRSFGELLFTVGETPVDGHPDLNVISNVGRTSPPTSTFHVDSSYFRDPPAYTALRAVEVPEHGGETLFSDQYRALDTLPTDQRAAVEGRTIRHVVTGVEVGPEDEVAADHPVVRRHPLSGRTSLYLTTPRRCESISGMTSDESRDTVANLYTHSTRADNVLRHAWAPGDVVMWDNGCVLHRADHTDVVGDRVMHRGMVAGYGPAATSGR